MHNTEDHASIDIKNLATSLRKEFETLHPLSDECCIYRIPHNRRQLNVGLYNPKVVSIGPLHHGREGLKAMEEFKKRYLQDFLQRTKPSEIGMQNGELKTLVAPTITELHQAGVKFKLGSSNHLFDIRFKNGTLEIPKLTLVDETQALIANLQDFEALNCEPTYVNDYVVIMNYLVNSPKDVEVLVHNEIIENWLSDNEDVSTLFQNLQWETNVDGDDFTYAGLIDDLKAYCKSPWHKWKATLKQNYFNNPWASISVIAAVVLLILTVIQTMFSIIK
ncbi:putative UPF0481 protein At3g02645 [Pistacia vera]|uniref:putative UPF0481 protein At3g02645 n=1 Tax=Pistacia vera TaxID=55513 RepID=UPI001262F162|nr:putative UPF0481 protein At3g02645 [Pistacia vera]